MLEEICTECQGSTAGKWVRDTDVMEKKVTHEPSLEVLCCGMNKDIQNRGNICLLLMCE